ncbi:MAG: glucose-6-phosphate dehydrogenase [Halieaceae bacterium]
MNSDLLIVGGEGDLALRKLYPALFSLWIGGSLNENMTIVALARRELDQAQFLALVREWFDQNKDDRGIDEEAWSAFAARLHYVSTDATSAEGLEKLRQQQFADEERGLVVYLATPPAIFAPVCRALEGAGLARPTTRIVVEKPLGHDRESFLEINRDLCAIFTEEQVYRIDHYLGKETVQNLLSLRFANAFFEPLWNNQYIDNVQITVAESIGVSGRWDFYDEAGAMRDMVQNHLLQLMCLTAMEPPAHLSSTDVHNEKIKVLSCLRPMDDTLARENTVTGQYGEGAVDGQPVIGYSEEEGAQPGSTTETFVAIKAEIENWRWAGVPFYLRTGKRLPKRMAEIVIEFKHVPHSIFGAQGAAAAPNRLLLRLQPDEIIRLELMNKVPGIEAGMPLKKVSLDLGEPADNKTPAPGAYERLLLDVLRENSTLFMRADEVEQAWVWIDQIHAAWESIGKTPQSYTAGNWGPTDAIALVARDGRSWNESN